MKHTLIFMFSLLLFQTSVLAQDTRTVTGVVSEADTGLPIPGANIIEKGTTNGVVTDFDGEFSINVPTDATLVVSYVGFATQEIAVSGSTEISVGLEPQTSSLEEVVVVAYGEQKKRTLTGSVSSVDTDQLTGRAVSSTQDALQGISPGVTVLQRPGDIGSTASITIRGRSNLGSSGPMYIIDGIPANAQEFASLNPNDIDNMSVLKDASSAALYGSRAANGVILITTKRGSGSGTSISFNTSYGWQNATRLPDYVNSVDYANLYNEALSNAGRSPVYNDEQIRMFGDGSNPDLYPNTNWYDEVLQKNAPQREANLSIRAPGELANYYLSLSYFDQESMIPDKKQDRIVAKLNTQSQVIEDLLEVGTNFSFINWANEQDGYMNWTELNRSLPITTARQSDGSWGSISGGEANAQAATSNQLRNLAEGGSATNDNNYFQMAANVTLTPLEGLSINGMTSLKYSNLNSWTFNSTMDPINNFLTGDPMNSTRATPNQMTEYWRKRKELLVQATVNYEKSFDKHNFNVILGASQESNTYRNAFLGRRNFPNDDMTTIGSGSTSPSDIVSDGEGQANRTTQEEWAIRSFFGRLNYNFDEKYLVELNTRIDYSSRFHEDERRAIFPSFSAGWVLSEEDFMENLFWLDHLKIRGSYGSLGNQDVVSIGNYFDILDSGYAYSFEGQPLDGVWQSRGTNRLATWEKVNMLDIGLDIALFNNKLDVVADYYVKNTDGILTQLPVLSTYGLPTIPFVNAAETRNTGFEFGVRYSDWIGDDFTYSVGANFSTINNEILDLGDGVNERINGLWIERVGGSVGDFYGYESNGLFVDQADVDNHAFQAAATSPGDIKYVDQNQDGVINADDRTIIGNDVPWMNYGFDFSAKYKNFDLEVLTYGVAKVKTYFSGEAAHPFFNGAGVKEEHKNRWTADAPNPDADFPRLLLSQDGTHNYGQTSDFWLFHGDYFRIRSITFGYTVPGAASDKIGLSMLRVYAAANNPFTFMKDSRLADYDPEMGSGRGGYPGIKTFSIGLSARF